MPVRYQDLENRYGEAIAQFLVKEMEKAAKVPSNDNDVDFEARLTRAQQAQDKAERAAL